LTILSDVILRSRNLIPNIGRHDIRDLSLIGPAPKLRRRRQKEARCQSEKPKENRENVTNKETLPREGCKGQKPRHVRSRHDTDSGSTTSSD